MKKIIILFVFWTVLTAAGALKAQNVSENITTDTAIKHHKHPGFVDFFQDIFSPGKEKEKKAYKEGYKAGVKEQLKKFRENFVDNQVPYYYWQSPIVQKVKIPAQLVNGFFIPSHYEYVIIQPGKWQKEYAYPIAKGESR
ncbi:MAG: hypothetical protein M1501_00660 [Candidatus Omnitrophica bacterium]|nr:hypothetical protein [Candidatus Omnitrophota bacterium]